MSLRFSAFSSSFVYFAYLWKKRETMLREQPKLNTVGAPNAEAQAPESSEAASANELRAKLGSVF